MKIKNKHIDPQKFLDCLYYLGQEAKREKQPLIHDIISKSIISIKKKTNVNHNVSNKTKSTKRKFKPPKNL